ncbi:MAG: bifunctional adenosylcobinamide kinase/adenosylcobinamide-phosphate guanylyltransferase [Spirochaetales bacterium]|nr:bifunctional adenosylcobinamide kinase/adenosylcobinamide-phosphate guanylyltransferase [Spirochaetales bacterium]
MGKITLVLGGTKSGKTSLAQNRASELSGESGKNVSYIATALALDGGMEKRIEAHQRTRPAEWQTAEEPLKVSAILSAASIGKAAVIIDCLTMLATNIIMELGEDPAREEAQALVTSEVKAILAKAAGIDAELIIISNLVEVGLVAPTRLGGIFQDIAGISHQIIAAAADEVILMTAGIPQKLKG